MNHSLVEHKPPCLVALSIECLSYTVPSHRGQHVTDIRDREWVHALEMAQHLTTFGTDDDLEQIRGIGQMGREE